jgi:Spy/CpxP family protein refolding chaperone
MTKRFWITAIAATLGVATLCIAQGPGPRRFAEGGPARASAGQFEALKTFLGLSDTQIAALRQVRTDVIEQTKPNRQQNTEKARALREEMAKANPDANTVGRLMTELKQAREQGRDTQAQVREKSLAVLTDAQKAKLKALEDAAALQTAVREARMSGLIEAPEGAGNGPMMRRGFGPRR